jgi:putative glutamine amidotransferase
LVKIALTHTGNPEKHQFYIDWLKSGSDDIEIVALSAKDNNLDELNRCDALVLSGGIDVHPSYYGATGQYEGAPDKFHQARDEFEMSAYHAAQEKQMPVLGICRGMQLINVIHKGTMIQNLGELNATHKGEPDKSHDVNVETGTLLFDIVGDKRTAINSAHHQAIGKIGEGLKVNALSDEGIAEGIERADPLGKPFLLAIQWHPERMFRFNLENSPASRGLRERFLQEAKKSIIANK